MSVVVALTRAEVKRLIRDPMMVYVACMPLVFALAIRFGLPRLTPAVSGTVDLLPHYDFIQAVLIAFGPQLYGFVAGFMLLDDRDEHILSAVAVTPLRQRGYVGFRLQFVVIGGFVVNLIAVPLAGIARYSFAGLIPVALLASLGGPLLALFLAGFARNKVEGLALGKLINFVIAGSFVGYFVAFPLHLLGGFFPAYWVTQAFLSMSRPGPDYWLYLVGGLAVHLGIGWLLLRRFVHTLR